MNISEISQRAGSPFSHKVLKLHQIRYGVELLPYDVAWNAAAIALMACHGIFSKVMYIHGFPFDTLHSLDDIRLGAQRMYYGGDLAEVLLAILLFNGHRRRSRYNRNPFVQSSPAL